MMFGNTPLDIQIPPEQGILGMFGGFHLSSQEVSGCLGARKYKILDIHWIFIGYLPVLILIAFSECLRHWIANLFLWKFNRNGIAVGCCFTCLKHCKECSTPYMFYMCLSLFPFWWWGVKCNGSALSVPRDATWHRYAPSCQVTDREILQGKYLGPSFFDVGILECMENMKGPQINTSKMTQNMKLNMPTKIAS